jgi:hypothetical protein
VAVVEQIVNAPADRVWAILADGWTYSDWVVGTAHIRDVDPAWPRTGAKIHHKAGPWPVSLKDHTVVLDHTDGRRLLMRARLWPLGEATVDIELTELPDGAHTRVTISEDFAAGPLNWVRTKINDLALHGRNRESLRRLADFATRRAPRTTP